MTAQETAALSVHGVSKRFPGVVALDGVDLTLLPGHVHALAGENGAGKSSLIKVLCGAQQLDAGQMLLGGAPYAPASPLHALRAGIRVVHQELPMLEHLNVAENLLFEDLPRNKLGWLDRAALHRRAEELLTMVGLTDLSSHRPVAGLGMAQRQLIEIAKALSGSSRILIMDEPTATLTRRETERLFGIVRKLRDQGVAILFVSHHLQELFDIGDEVTVLRNGRRVAHLPLAQTSASELVRMMVGRELTAQPREDSAHAPPTTTQPPALAVRGLRYAGQPADASFDFSVNYGQVLGIAGLVGSGRTEVLRAIFGADRKEAGEVLRDGAPVRINHPRDALAAGICLATEDRKDEGLLLDMPVRANVTLAALANHSRALWLKPQAERTATHAMVHKLDVRLSSIEQPPRELSGGNQQKVVLAKWLLRQPKVLLLDEPTRGVDVGGKAEIHALLRAAAADGLALIVVSSDLPELLALADRIIVFSKGVATGEVARAEFDEQTILELAYREYLRNADAQRRAA